MIIVNKSFNKFIYPVLDPEKKVQSFWIIFVCYNLQRNRKKNLILIYMIQCLLLKID